MAVAAGLVLAGGVVVVATRGSGCSAFVSVLQETPDRGQGVIDRSGGRSVYDVVALRSDLSVRRRITHDAIAQDPAFAPGGHRIAFADGRGYSYDPEVGPAKTSIYLANAAGGREQRLTQGDDRAPSWSPDGSSIAFLRASERSTSTELWTVDVATRHETEIATGEFASMAPLWLPGGAVGAYVEHGQDVSLVVGGRSLGLRQSVRPVVWNPGRTAYAFVAGVHSPVQVHEVKSGNITTVPDSAATFSSISPIAWTSDNNLLLERPVRAGLVELLSSTAAKGRPRVIGKRYDGAAFLNFADNPACGP
jgi:dipeptidyl aminopeptidase/acylaminoacyl peptidase